MGILECQLNLDDAQDVLAGVGALPDKVGDWVGTGVFWWNVIAAIKADIMIRPGSRFGLALASSHRSFLSEVISVVLYPGSKLRKKPRSCGALCREVPGAHNKLFYLSAKPCCPYHAGVLEQCMTRDSWVTEK